MSDRTDQELLDDFARTGSNDAFAELAHRHVDLIYSAAFRVLRNTGLAEDVTQRTFVALVQNARKLRNRSVLIGWLHETTRNFAIATVRAEERRRLREQEVAIVRTIMSPNAGENDPAWDQLTPHLDDALAQLSEGDRDTILLRYFERKTAREIGQRFGLTEEAAQKRAARALDRLRAILAERGLAVPIAGLAGLLSAQAIQSAPVGLTASVIGAAGTTGAVLSASSNIGLIMASTKTKLGLAAVLVAGISTPLVIQHQNNTQLRDEVAALLLENAELVRLRGENRPPMAQPIEDQEIQRRKDEHAELMRLRGEVASLRARADDMLGARGELTKPPAPAPKMGETPPVAAATWANVGFATPADAIQTLHWARANRDTNTIRNAVAWADEKTKAAIDALFAAAPAHIRAQYGSADGFIVGAIDNPSLWTGTNRIVNYRIISESTAGNVSNLEVQWQSADGGGKTEPVQLVRVGDAWRESLSFADRALRRFATQLQVEAPVPAESPGDR